MIPSNMVASTAARNAARSIRNVPPSSMEASSMADNSMVVAS